jgi:hypothetical protein
MPSNRVLLAILGVVIVLLVAVGFITGRLPMPQTGAVGNLVGDLRTTPQSTAIIDSTSLLHVEYGMLVYLLLWMILPDAPAHYRFMVAVGVGAGSILIENSAFINERYREVTMSVRTFGTSIVSSVGDVLMIAIGSLIAWRAPRWMSIGLALALEMCLAMWVRTNLTLTIITFFLPAASIRSWQAGGLH